MVIVNKETFKDLMASPKPVIIDAYASWCGPCMYMKPIFERLSQELSNSYVFAELNVDEAREIAIQLGISSVPTFIFMDKGTVKNKVTGALSQEDFQKKIQESFGTQV